MLGARDHYATLGVDSGASEDEIKRAYRRLTLELHPDRRPDDQEAAERFRAVNQAYDVLGDPARRARYDVERRLGALDLPTAGVAQTARDVLDHLVGDVFGSRLRSRRRGRDVRYTLSVELEEAVLGSVHEIEFEAPTACSTCSGSGSAPGGPPPETCTLCAGHGELRPPSLLARRVPCGRCGGTGMLIAEPCRDCLGRGTRRQVRGFSVRLPPGTEAGAERVLANQGEPGRFGGEAGDLRVTVNVRPHPFLRREGDDITCELAVSLTEAALGARLPVAVLGGSVRMDLPPGTVTGARLRLRGKGVPGARGRGDQIVTVRVETPVAIGPAVAAALRQLDQACEAEPATLPDRARQRAFARARDEQD